MPASASNTSVTCCPLPAGTGISDLDRDTNGQHTPSLTTGRDSAKDHSSLQATCTQASEEGKLLFTQL